MLSRDDIDNGNDNEEDEEDYGYDFVVGVQDDDNARSMTLETVISTGTQQNIVRYISVLQSSDDDDEADDGDYENDDDDGKRQNTVIYGKKYGKPLN